MKILVVGGNGQLGRALVQRGDRHQLFARGRELDICDSSAIAEALDATAPRVVIDAAAYTAVDRAESEPALAYRVNRDGAAIVARECARRSIRLLHVSTDYVFDGSATTPYREDAPTRALGIYGDSKAAGDAAVLDAGGVVVRASWLFFERGNNFVRTMLKLARERPLLRVVVDQIGCPTYAGDLADALLALAAMPELPPILHYCGDGATSWFDFARAIVAEARRHVALVCERVEPITTAEYPTAARRPAYSVLDTSKIRSLGIAPRAWSSALHDVIPAMLEDNR
jgi:dTDP-4-dehydrorhamnose reductase